MEKTKAHPHIIGVAAGMTAGFVYAICAAAIIIWPTQALNFFNNWFHGIDLTKIARPMQLTFSNFIIGFLGIVLTFYFIGLIYSLIYNICYSHCKKNGVDLGRS